MTDPTRLLQEEHVPASLRGALGEAQADAPTEADLEAIARSLPFTTAPRAPASATPRARNGRLLTYVIGAVLVSLASSAVWMMVRSDVRHGDGAVRYEQAMPGRGGVTPARPGRIVANETPRVAADEAAAPVPVAAPAVASSPRVARHVVLAKPGRRRGAVAAPHRPTTFLKVPTASIEPNGAQGTDPPVQPIPATAAPSVPSEVALIEAARMAVRAAPARCLALTGEHGRLYPRGLHAEEREVLAIEASARLGRAQEAFDRASRFRAAHADSIYAARVDAAVGRQRTQEMRSR